MLNAWVQLFTVTAPILGQRNVEEFVTELRDVPQGWYAVGAIAIVAALCAWAVWMYRREGRGGASAPMRNFLAVIRCLVIVLIAAILLDPIRVRILRKWIDSYTVVLIDDSSSMGLIDTYRDAEARRHVTNIVDFDEQPSVRRADLARRLLESDERAVLRNLADNNRIKLYTFSEEPLPVATLRAGWEGAATESSGTTAALEVDDLSMTLNANGPATNLERALRRAVESLGSAPIAAVVVVTDGGLNQGASVEPLARYARERRIPIHAVGVGDPSPPQNVRVAEVLAPENVFQNDPFPITVRLAAEGLDGASVRVELREAAPDRGGEGRVVDTKTVRVGPGGAVEPLTFQRQQNRVGRYAYTVEAPLLEAESVADDNSKQVTVNVIDTRTRVLIVSGHPSWHYRFVSRLLERDATFDVSCWLQSADLSAVRDGNTIIDHLPILAEELFAYDLIILLDPSPEDLTEDWCRLVDTFVTDHGGGLLYAAARPHTPMLMREPWFQPVRDLLPVTPDPEADLILNQIGHYQKSPSTIVIPEDAYGHSVLRVADDAAATALAWRGVGEIYWHYPVLREKPAATVLMRHGNPRMRNSYGNHVLAAVQFVGAGRTGFLAFDTSWRWRRFDPALFDRFWVQLTRYLAEGKLLGGSKRGTILTERDRYAIGDSVAVSARLFNARYEPLILPEIKATLTVDEQRRDLVLSAQPDRPGWYSGRFVPDRTGAYVIRITMPGAPTDAPLEIAREIRVARPNIEIVRPQMARADLIALAEGSYGGRYFEVDQVGELPDLIPDLHAEIPIRSRPTTLWDNGWTLALLIVLLSVEWGLRKWNRLL